MIIKIKKLPVDFYLKNQYFKFHSRLMILYFIDQYLLPHLVLSKYIFPIDHKDHLVIKAEIEYPLSNLQKRKTMLLTII